MEESSRDDPHRASENDDGDRGSDVERTLMMVASGVVGSQNAVADVSTKTHLTNLFVLYNYFLVSFLE